MPEQTEQLTHSLQDNILTLIVFDDAALPLLYTTLQPGHFESDFYKEIVKRAFEYYREFKCAPGEHISDLFESQLIQKANEQEAKVYQRILVSLYRNKENINREYVLSQLNKFIRQQTLKDGITGAYQDIKDGKLDDAELKLSKAINNQIKIFEPGVSLTDTSQSLKFLVDPTLS